jgi:hypothetical protein
MRTSTLLTQEAHDMRGLADRLEQKGGHDADVLFLREVARDSEELASSLPIDLDMSNLSSLHQDAVSRSAKDLDAQIAEAEQANSTEGARLLRRMKGRLLTRERRVIFGHEEE